MAGVKSSTNMFPIQSYKIIYLEIMSHQRSFAFKEVQDLNMLTKPEPFAALSS